MFGDRGNGSRRQTATVAGRAKKARQNEDVTVRELYGGTVPAEWLNRFFKPGSSF